MFIVLRFFNQIDIKIGYCSGGGAIGYGFEMVLEKVLVQSALND
jgi:hypothetical protein